MSWFTYRQNNSFGYFQEPAHYVLIEAKNAEQADAIAVTLGLYFNGCETARDCPCCGDRWYPTAGKDGSEEPEIYGKSPRSREAYGYIIWGDVPTVALYYLDGRQEIIDYR